MPASASPVYATSGPNVNGKQFDSVPLLAGLPLDADCLNVYLLGAVVHSHSMPRKWARLLSALLSRIREHSNRVWPGIQWLSERAGTSERTAKRFLAWLRSVLGIRVVGGDELTAGPGPHRYDGEKRSSREVNTYDLSPFAAMLSEQELAALVVVAAPRRARRAVPTPSVPPLDDLTEWADPFAEGAEQPATVPGDSGGTSETLPRSLAPQATRAARSGTASESERSDTALSTEVAINGRWERGERDAAGPRKPALRAKIGPHNSEGSGVAALRGLGVWPRLAAKICRERGDGFGVLLARYVRIIEQRGQVQPDARAAYAVATAKDFTAWPDWFAARIEREQRAAGRIYSSNQENMRDSNETMQAAGGRSAAPDESEPEPWALAAALAQVREMLPSATVYSRAVVARARSLMRQGTDGEAGGSDSG
jgi:hypothetical protein